MQFALQVNRWYTSLNSYLGVMWTMIPALSRSESLDQLDLDARNHSSRVLRVGKEVVEANELMLFSLKMR